MDTHVLVLNASYEPLQRVSLHHAIKMLVRQVAVVEESDGMFGCYPRPLVLRLVRYVVTRWIHRRQQICTKAAIRVRDGMCAYCAGPAETVDHIIPRSRGGDLSWENAVAACLKCNNRKANRTPAEAGMELLLTPGLPSLRGLPAYSPAVV